MAKKNIIKKNIIDVQLTDVSPHELEGTLEALRNQIDQWIAEHGATARLCWDGDFWPRYSDSVSPRYEIKISREETDAEYEHRRADEVKMTEKQDARDKAEFKRLQKMFGVK